MIASQFDLFLFDLDGVVYIGAEPLPGAVESIRRLRNEKKRIRFLTNDPCATRESACARLHKLGVDVSIDEMITSSYAAAAYMKEQGISSAYVLSDGHLQQECLRAGIDVHSSERPDAVVLGWDSHLTLHHIQKAAQLIANGAMFIAASPDLTYPTPDGPALATGSLVEMLKAATGVNPAIIGKPHSAMFQAACQTCPSIPKERIVMIGDNPLTDILGAHQFGISAILISNKNTDPYPVKSDFRNPDRILSNLKFLFEPNLQFKPWPKTARVWPEEIKAAATAVIFNHEGHVLFVKRKDNKRWSLPTGRVEIGESVEQAVVREVREETGLIVEAEKLIGVYSDPEMQTFVYPDGRAIQFITSCFQCSVVGGQVKQETDEVLEVRFFSLDNLPDNMLPMHAARMKEIMALRS